LADVIAHLSSRRDGLINVPKLLDLVDITDGQRIRLRPYRMLMAIFWLAMLLPETPDTHETRSGRPKAMSDAR